jgi:glycosyltransferase involved in cell wall biosynthesis
MNPPAVVHLVDALEPGGIENWLVELARRVDRSRVRLVFAHRSPGPFGWSAELQRLGVELVHVPGHPRPDRFAPAFAALLHRLTPVAVHGHIGPFNGLMARVAAECGVPRRIAHAHTDEAMRRRAMGRWREAYELVMREWIRCLCTHGLAVSGIAAASLFGEGWADDPRWRVRPCGIDLGRFADPPSRHVARAALSLSDGQPTVLAVGRLDAVKNHRFLIDVVAGMPGVALLIAGDGELHGALQAHIAQRGVADRVRLLGRRGDIPQLAAAADAFAMPSRYEGLGLALIEAQATGLACVASDAVPVEAAAVSGLVARVPLVEDAWRSALATALAAPRRDGAAARAELVAGGHGIDGSARDLTALWLGEAG